MRSDEAITPQTRRRHERRTGQRRVRKKGTPLRPHAAAERGEFYEPQLPPRILRVQRAPIRGGAALVLLA